VAGTVIEAPGGYRKTTVATRVLSVIAGENHKQWFQSIWSGLTGASTRNHPAPYPEGLAERLIRMFSFVGDTVLDPFMGTGTTAVAAAKWAETRSESRLILTILKWPSSAFARRLNRCSQKHRLKFRLLDTLGRERWAARKIHGA
jgi:hypothetical protein